MKVGGENESPVFVMWAQCVFGAGTSLIKTVLCTWPHCACRLFATTQGVDKRVQPVCWWQGGECVDSGYHGAIIQMIRPFGIWLQCASRGQRCKEKNCRPEWQHERDDIYGWRFACCVIKDSMYQEANG